MTIGDPCVGVEQPMMGPSHERSSAVVHLNSGATISADRLLVATGRRPNVDAWRSSRAGTDRAWLAEGGPFNARSAAWRFRSR